MNKTSAGLKRELNTFDATMLVIGSMIGSGIFIVSADMARTLGSSGLLIVVWLITGVVTLIGALSYGELAGMMPQAGGQYVYLREAYNPLIGFLYGWTLFMVIQSGSIAAVGVAFAKYTGVIIPWFSSQNIIFSAGGFKFTTEQLLAILCVSFLTYVNYRGLKEGKIVQDIFTVAKTAALFGIIVLGLLIARNYEAISANLTNMWDAEWIHLTSEGAIDWIEPLSGIVLIAAIGSAMVGSLFSSDAWNNVTFTAAEIKNPKKAIPLSLAYGSIIVTVLYILANLAYLAILPLEGDPNGTNVMQQGIQFAANDRVGTAAATGIFGDLAAVIMAVFIMISTFGCNNGMILTGARVYYAMALDNLFFKSAGKLNKHSVPGAALVMQGIWSGLLCLSGTYSQLLDYVIFAVLIFYILTIIGIFILRKKQPDTPRPYKAFGYPYLPILYIILALGINIILLVFKPEYTWPGLIIVLAGIPIYYLWSRKTKSSL